MQIVGMAQVMEESEGTCRFWLWKLDRNMGKMNNSSDGSWMYSIHAEFAFVFETKTRIKEVAVVALLPFSCWAFMTQEARSPEHLTAVQHFIKKISYVRSRIASFPV